ncbi:MAG: PqqD family protein [Myxococcales bacterium]
MPIRTDPHQEMAVFRLNEVGAFLWQALSRPVSERTLCRMLAGEFEVSADQARRDLTRFLDILKSKQLIEQR